MTPISQAEHTLLEPHKTKTSSWIELLHVSFCASYSNQLELASIKSILVPLYKTYLSMLLNQSPTLKMT